MTLSKLSLRNAKRQAGDYLIYFATIVMVCAMLYAFNALIFSDELNKLSAEMKNLPLIITLSSIVVVFIIGWLVSYTTGFMLSRRSRELGTYLLIGLENKQVARLFFLENLSVGSVAILFGVPLGNLVFQALRAILLTMFIEPYHFQFYFSPQAIGLTLLYFILIFFSALRRSRKRIKKMKIYDLIYAERKNEEEIVKKEKIRKVIFTLSIMVGAVGIFLLTTTNNLMPGVIGAGCIIVFLYGFFLSFSSGVPAFFDKRPERKYKKQNLLIFRLLSSKLSTMGMAMAAISVLFTATILTESVGMVFNTHLQRRVEQNSFDLLITTKNESSLAAALNHAEKQIPLVSSWKYRIYQREDGQFSDYLTGTTSYYSTDNDLMLRYSDYAALRAMLHYPSVELEPGTYLVHCLPYMESTLQKWNHSLCIGDQSLALGSIQTEQFGQKLWEGNGNQFILVIPDELCVDAPVYRYALSSMTQEPIRQAQYDALCNVIGGAIDGVHSASTGKDLIYSKTVDWANCAATSAITVFPLFYLALTLAMAATTVLTVQQLSEARRYYRQFELLRKLGMDEQEMKKTLFSQLAIYYAMPAVPPVLVATPFVRQLSKTIEAGAVENPPMILATSLGLFFLIYLTYIVIAYSSMRRNVLPDE